MTPVEIEKLAEKHVKNWMISPKPSVEPFVVDAITEALEIQKHLDPERSNESKFVGIRVTLVDNTTWEYPREQLSRIMASVGASFDMHDGIFTIYLRNGKIYIPHAQVKALSIVE